MQGLAIREGEHGTGRLILDLDFIVEWRKAAADAVRFLVASATLTFNAVTDLNVNVNYAGSAMGPFSIAGIDRELKTYPNGFMTYQWRIPVNFPEGHVSFVAAGFLQTLRCEPNDVDRQHLTLEERARGGAV